MNADQRKKLADLVSQLNDIRDEIENIKGDEEDKYDNLPESLQDAELGEGIQEAIDTLEDGLSYLSDAIDSIEGIC